MVLQFAAQLWPEVQEAPGAAFLAAAKVIPDASTSISDVKAASDVIFMRAISVIHHWSLPV